MTETWLIDARTFSFKPTGVGLYAFREIKRILSNSNLQLQLVLLADVNESRELQELERLGCEVRTYGRRIFKSWVVIRYFAWMKRMVADVRPDVFWEPNNLLPFHPRGVGRVIVTMHDVFGLGWNWKYAPWLLYYRFSFWRTLGNVTEIWYNSSVTKRQVEDYVAAHKASRRFALSASSRITHPIADVPPVASIASWKWRRPYFFYVGNVEGRKGADVLIEAYRRYRGEARSEGDAFDLVIAGLERNVKVPDEPGFVKLGYVDEATKFSLMKSCAAFVVPSRDEGYGMQLAEALKLGVRTIASDVPVFEEVTDEQGAHTQNVTWLKGFAAGTDERRVALLKDALLKICYAIG